MSEHDRTQERVEPKTGQTIVTVEGPSEIASWVFPREPEDDEQRAALKAEIEALLDKRIAEALGTGKEDQRQH